jgi:Spy/CpxP family protein refolding chaperone
LEAAAPKIDLTEEQRAAIYDAIDYTEAAAEVDMPKDVLADSALINY